MNSVKDRVFLTTKKIVEKITHVLVRISQHIKTEEKVMDLLRTITQTYQSPWVNLFADLLFGPIRVAKIVN